MISCLIHFSFTLSFDPRIANGTTGLERSMLLKETDLPELTRKLFAHILLGTLENHMHADLVPR